MNLHNQATQNIAYIFIVYINIYMSMCIYSFTIVVSPPLCLAGGSAGVELVTLKERKCSRFQA